MYEHVFGEKQKKNNKKNMQNQTKINEKVSCRWIAVEKVGAVDRRATTSLHVSAVRR